MKLLDNILNMLKDPKTYKEIAYLLLAMPFGIAYFVVLVTGFSLGAGLAVIGVGVLIIAAMMAFGRVGGWVEALLAKHLLDADIEPSLDLRWNHDQTFLANVGRILTDGKAIRSLIFLSLKFPLGLFTFVVSIIALTIPAAFISAPFTYNSVPISFGDKLINTPFEAVIAMLVGLILLPIALGALKGMATIWRKLAEAMLISDVQPEKRKRKQKRDMSHLMDEYETDDDYDADYNQDYETEELVMGLRQLLDK